jgi:mycofactocin system creatininase family protein
MAFIAGSASRITPLDDPARPSPLSARSAMSLAELTWGDAQRRGSDPITLAVPLGATEQHGPHLPLTTDTEIAAELVARLARARADVVAAPAVPYGSSGEHAGFAGTVSIGQEAVQRLLIELCRSATDSFARILLVSAHGGNREPLARAVTQLQREGRAIRSWEPSWSGDAHAGHTETSIMLALAPDRVWMDQAQLGVVEPIESLLPRLKREGVRAVSPNGVLGDPVGACAQAGQELLDRAETELVKLLDGWD